MYAKRGSSPGVPSSGPPSLPGCQCTTSSIFFANAKSLSVMPFGCMGFQAHFHPGVRRRQVRMVPSGLGEVAHGINHHQRAFPPVRTIGAADPAVLIAPVRQFGIETRLDLGFVVGLLSFFCAHENGPLHVGRTSMAISAISVQSGTYSCSGAILRLRLRRAFRSRRKRVRYSAVESILRKQRRCVGFLISAGLFSMFVEDSWA